MNFSSLFKSYYLLYNDTVVMKTLKNRIKISFKIIPGKKKIFKTYVNTKNKLSTFLMCNIFL